MNVLLITSPIIFLFFQKLLLSSLAKNRVQTIVTNIMTSYLCRAYLNLKRKAGYHLDMHVLASSLIRPWNQMIAAIFQKVSLGLPSWACKLEGIYSKAGAAKHFLLLQGVDMNHLSNSLTIISQFDSWFVIQRGNTYQEKSQFNKFNHSFMGFKHNSRSKYMNLILLHNGEQT